MTESTTIAEYEAEIQRLKDLPKTKDNAAAIRKAKSGMNRLYNDSKRELLKFEEKNYEYLFFLCSTNGFYKLIGHSALFYVHDIAPKLDLTANLQRDGDYTERSEHGVASVVNIDRIAERLKQLKIERTHTNKLSSSVIAFKLPWKFTKEQVEKFIEDDVIAMQRFNHVVMANNLIPNLYIQMIDLNKAILQNVRRMKDPTERETLGYDMIKIAVKNERIYFDMANGKVTDLDGLRSIRINLDFLKYQAKILADLKIWSARVYARIGENMIRMQDTLDAKIREINK